MFKTLSASLFAVFLFAGGIYAQNAASANEKKALTAKAYNLFQKGRFDDAIDTAEKVVKLEKNSNQTDTSFYVNALLNLARIRRENYSVLKNKFRDRNLTVTERIELSKKLTENGEEAEKLFREAARLNESGGRGQTAQTADIKSDLAWLIYNYFQVEGKPSIDKSRSRIDEAEGLFLESLALNEQIRGRDADETLFVALGAGNFYFHYHNYEKALPFYERYIETAGRKHGKNYAGLVNALRPRAKILRATFQEPESAADLIKIEEITGQKENLPKDDLILHLRSKDSVAYGAKNAAFIKRDAERVPVKVTADENGKIIEAVAETKNEKLREKAEREILSWTVRPFSYNGTPRKIRGYLIYTETR
ncbi:MAG TPA: tetratricopeptide repeat protein [Pyrinomonadaceae bacterium]|nr:tetratricopeptide repeat protein [Pyrinomonadaceae bacterium]